MKRPRNVPALAGVAALGALAVTATGACGDGREPVRVGVAPALTVPRALLDRAASVVLAVYEGQAQCEPTTGTLTLPEDAASAREIARRELGTSGCAGGARFCGDVTIDKSSAVRVFGVTAKDAAGETIAVGCASATVDRDAVPVAIAMFRYIAPAVCGDGTIQPTEQCEPGGTPLCDDGCQSNEILLSVGSSQNGTQTGGPDDKADPFFLWPAEGGAQGRFFAFFTDRAVAGGGTVDVGLRVMADDLGPVSSPPALAAGSIFLPNGPTFPPQAAPRQQSIPQAAFVRGKYYVVFQDDDTPGSNGLDIHLRSMDSALVADQGATPLGINGPSGQGEPNIQAAPALAGGPQDRLFIAWEDRAQGKIVGRTLAPPSTLGNQNDISTGTGNKAVSVAATPSGWVAVWQSGTGIKLRVINGDGTPQGAEQTVSQGGASAEGPRVAALADGRFAVAWSANGDVFVQRFDAKGAPLDGDQTAPVNDVITDGVQSEVAIAATPAAGGSYAMAWLDGSSGHVRGRMLGGSGGFLFNHVNGQSTEFQASRSDGRTRSAPAVVAGGSGPFVAIGWEDETAPGAGIVVRRFPLPEQ